MTEIHAVLKNQRAFFNSGQTKEISFRIKQLGLLKHAVVQNENKILKALYQDLGKSPYEAYLTEVGIVREEIGHIAGKVRAWARPKRVRTPFYHLPAVSHIYPEPYGLALIISPWNYPFQLAVAPLAAAIAAGNCAIMKPSEFSPYTSQAIADLVESIFDPAYITVVTGGVEVSTALLAENFNYIFFTGSPGVGKIVMAAAAAHLTPVTLELGGKSPCIVEPDANLGVAARRIVSGKFINTGQTCIAPDYLLVHQSIKEPLVDRMIQCIEQFYGVPPMNSPNYPKIVNRHHFDRLMSLTKGARIMYGGESDLARLTISPTLLDVSDMPLPVMREEIFGPILPVLEYGELREAINVVSSHPNPLALYLFSENRQTVDRVLKQISFGGGCINDTLIHLATPYMPFGGVGGSGMGGYHGKFGFDTFSHHKSVIQKSTRVDFPFRYPAFYNYMKLLKTILR